MSRWRSREEDAARPQGVRRNVYGGSRKGREGWTSSWGLLGPCDGSQDGVGRKGDGRGGIYRVWEGWLNGRRDGRCTGLEDDMMARRARGRQRPQDGVGRKGDGRGGIYRVWEGWLNGRRDGRCTGLEDDMMARRARGRQRPIKYILDVTTRLLAASSECVSMVSAALQYVQALHGVGGLRLQLVGPSRAAGSVPRLISAGWNSSLGNGTPPQLLLGGGVRLGGSRDARNNLAAWIYRSVWPRRCHGPCRVIVEPSSPAAASSAAARSPSVCPSGRDRRPVEAMTTAGPRQLGRRSSADAEDEVDDGQPDGDTRAPHTEADRGDAICCCCLTTARVDKERSWRSISPRRRRQR
uniref:Uncharacterized protein n=1 Tax=Oryza barthii TaxID=65489 RepID=A0A0D3H4M6_9ORYZ